MESLRGYSEVINLDEYSKRGIDWITGEQELFVIEKDLWSIPYTRLYPKDKKQYYLSTEDDEFIVIDSTNVPVKSSDFELSENSRLK